MCASNCCKIIFVKMHAFFYYQCFTQNTKMSFLKQQFSYETGASQPQLKSGAYVLESELQSTKQSQKLQFKDGYLSKDDQDEVVNSNMEIIRRDGWILDVQRLDGTKVSVHVPERKVISGCVKS